MNFTLTEKQKKTCFLAFVFLLYSGRLWYMYMGYLKNYAWLGNGDESHVYILGLRFFTDHVYPYWGPDITYFSSSLAGGMQGLLIGLPLFVWAHPFSPYLFLFMMLCPAMIYLSWYISKLFPDLPRWLIYGAIALAPFTIHTGMKILNPAYVLFFAIPFMLSLIEIFKIFPKRYIGARWCYFWIGLGVSAVFQLHASWAFLLILWGSAMVYTFLKRQSFAEIIPLYLSTILGLIVGAVSLLPTLYHYGVGVLLQEAHSSSGLSFSIRNITDIGALIYYFVTSCGYEMNSFSGDYRWMRLWAESYRVGAVAYVVLQIGGILIFVFQLVLPFWWKWRNHVIAYKRLLILNAVIIILLSSMYLFSTVRPGAHAILCIFPLSAIYLCWFFQGVLFINRIKYICFYVFGGLLVFYYVTIVAVTDQLPDFGYRDKAFKAIEKKDATLFETNRYPHPSPR